MWHAGLVIIVRGSRLRDTPLADRMAVSQIAPDAAPERRLEIQNLLARWALVRTQLVILKRRIETLVARCPEAKILNTVPEGERCQRRDDCGGARHAEGLRALSPSSEARRDESSVAIERAERGTEVAVQARPPNAAPPVLSRVIALTP